MRLIDADALSEKLCKTTVFIKDGEMFQRMINDAPTVSAEARPTVIRSRTLLPTKDFKEWAKRVRETNPNVIVIPCDAEVVSADAVQGEWIPCSDKLPSNNDCVLVTVDDSIEFGKYQDGEWSIWVCEHWDKWDAKGTIAWMPLPTPYKGGDSE